MKKFILLALVFIFPVNVFSHTSDEDILSSALWTKIINTQPSKRPSVGVALAGGGARAFTHAGFLEVMEYSGFPIDYVAGTSMGAVIGAFYASGKPLDDLWEVSRNVNKMKIRKDFFNIKMVSLLFSDEMLPQRNIARFINNIFVDGKIEDLKKPFACVAMDIRTGEKVIFRTGSVALAVRASSNIPGFFKPLEYDHRYLVDGGVVENIPVDVVKNMGAEWIIASIDNITSDKMPESILSVLMQVIDVRGGLLAAESLKKANFIISPPVGTIGTVDFDRAYEAGRAGVTETYQNLEKLKRAYILKSLPDVLDYK